MTFEAYLTDKKINSEAFRQGDGDTWSRWALHFEQMHPKSFTAQKLFLINGIRRKYPMMESPVELAEKPLAKAKPKFIRKKKE